LIKHAYLQIDEAFPTGAVINVDIAGTQYFVAVPADVTGFTVSSETNNFLLNPQTVTISITGVTGDVTTGKARVMFDVFHPNIKNGQFAVSE
jgi:phage tail sheath gpL-like